MKFNILINPTDNWLPSSQQALCLCQTIIEQGHEIGLVFFYGQSVNILNTENAMKDWQKWQQRHRIQLCLCSAMLEKENLMNTAETKNSFSVIGLASWVSAIEDTDKVLEFC